MTQEHEEVLADENEVTVEAADASVEEPQACEEDASRLTDDSAETAEEVNELVDEGQETAPEIERPVGEGPTPVYTEDEPLTEEAEEAEEDADGEERPDKGEEPTATVESVIEAILFASDESLTDSRLANIVETTAKQVRQSIASLNEKYESCNNAFRIEQIAGGYQMLTLSSYNRWLKKMLRVRGDTKLSPAAMETLAIIAYKQPIIRADIEAIRGVAVGEVVRSLMYKGLVKIVGRAEVLGRPMLYGTTRKFLEVFGLNSLKDLPKAEELKRPD